MLTRDFRLADWQQRAVDAWVTGDALGAHRGTLEVVTGGGKTLIALACVARAAALEPELRVAVVVPTEALARQWRDAIERYTTIPANDIGLLGAGGRGTFSRHRALVAVLNTAARRLPELSQGAQPLMLIVDECHRAGAPGFSRVLQTEATFRLGLSATPEREELDEDGEPLAYDEQAVGRSLGSVVYQFTLRDAREAGWLPDYEIHHHGLQLSEQARRDYDSLSRRVDEIADRLRDMGVDAGRAQTLRARDDELGRVARAYVAVTSQRKDLLYRAEERQRVTRQLVKNALREGPRRILLFHERVDEAVNLHHALSVALPELRVALEHSSLPTRERTAAMDAFRQGEASVLVSVKSLVEGIDVPEADVGISVASTSSVRQRIQSLGRVLRRQFTQSDTKKHAEMHVLYVAETVDEAIYSKEDWSDLTGEAANRYWLWPLDPDERPTDAGAPPATPLPTEDQEWERLGGRAPDQAVPWLGSSIGQEYSVDTLGNVTNSFGTTIANPQNVASFVAAVRGRPGGRFRVTPSHRLVLVRGESDEGRQLLVAGQLDESFVAASDVPVQPDIDLSSLKPGDHYPGPRNKDGGTYRLRQKQGGVIERRVDHGAEFALVSGSPYPALEENAQRVIGAWRELLDRGITFQINERGDAWFTQEGEARFLAHVAGGFVWPSTSEEV